jgi:beta-xylosidase
VYTTKDVERGPWKATSFEPSLHDHSLFFDDDGRVYMLYGGGDLRLAELSADVSGLKPGGFHDVVVPNASRVAGADIMLPAEGSQLLKHGDKYYLFNIAWPRGGMRTSSCTAHRITGSRGRVALQDKGTRSRSSTRRTASGSRTLPRLRGGGRILPVPASEGRPMSVDGKVPDTLSLPASKGLMPGIIASDEFDRRPGEPALPLAWQWNHNPDDSNWSLTRRPGFLGLTTGGSMAISSARNTLTQRTTGLESAGTTVSREPDEGRRLCGLALQHAAPWA